MGQGRKSEVKGRKRVVEEFPTQVPFLLRSGQGLSNTGKAITTTSMVPAWTTNCQVEEGSSMGCKSVIGPRLCFAGHEQGRRCDTFSGRIR